MPSQRQAASRLTGVLQLEQQQLQVWKTQPCAALHESSGWDRLSPAVSVAAGPPHNSMPGVMCCCSHVSPCSMISHSSATFVYGACSAWAWLRAGRSSECRQRLFAGLQVSGQQLCDWGCRHPLLHWCSADCQQRPPSRHVVRPTPTPYAQRATLFHAITQQQLPFLRRCWLVAWLHAQMSAGLCLGC